MTNLWNKLKDGILVVGGLLGAVLLFLKFKKSDVLANNEKTLQDVAKLDGQKQEIDTQLKTEEAKQEELKKQLGKEPSHQSNEDLAKYFNNK